MYSPEFDDLRQEVRISTASTVVFWPKAEGVGNAVASATPSDNTFTVKDPGGVVLQASQNVTVSTQAGVSRFDLAVPSIATLGEDHFCEVLWRVSGSSFVRKECVFFDVVREPWGPSSVSLSSMQSLVPDIADRLNRQGARLSQASEARASVLGHQARIELGNWLRQAVADDSSRLAPVVSDTRISRGSDLAGYLRPRLVKDKARLHAIEVRLAIHFAFAADMRADADAGDPLSAIAAYWLEAAKQSFRSIGPLKYDLDEDDDVDTEIAEVGRFSNQRRVQS